MIEVTVFGYGSAATLAGSCDPGTGCCGPSPMEVAEQVQHLVATKFPGQYQVKYVDTFSIDAFDYGDVLQAIQAQDLSLPVLALAGHLKLSGEFSLTAVEKLLREVETI